MPNWKSLNRVPVYKKREFFDKYDFIRFSFETQTGNGSKFTFETFLSGLIWPQIL